MRGYNLKLKNKGSAIIMALVTMTLLVMLGLAVITLSMGNLQVNTADAANNDAFYGAEAGVNSAIEQIKYETSSYYKQMLEAESSDYSTLYSNFFSNITSNANTHFAEPVVSEVSVSTTVTQGEYDEDQDLCEFLISSTATAADGASYRVNGSIYIKRVDVSAGGGGMVIPDAALLAGGTFDLGNNSGSSVYAGDVVVADIQRQETEQLDLKDGAELIINLNAGDIINDSLTYPSYSDPVIASPYYYKTEDYTFNSDHFNGLDSVTIDTADGVNLHFASCTVPEGVIHGKGDMHMNNGTFYPDVYCDGDLHVNNCTFNGDIYCRGDLHINNAVYNGSIICDGFIDLNNGAFTSTVLAGEGVNIHNATSVGSMYTPGTITMKCTGVSGGIIYASTKLYIGNMSANAIFFSGGDIEITQSLSVTGAVYAKGDIYFKQNNKYLTVNYSSANMDGIIDDPDNSFFFEGGGGEPELDEDVIFNQDISAVGRID